MIWRWSSNIFLACATLSVVVAIGGCGENKNIVAAKKAIEIPLKDPGSVQYKDVTAFNDGVVCGSMNAKNSMGGYVGFEAFIYNYLGEPGRLERKAGDLQEKIWCNNNSNKMQAENAQRLETAKFILSVTEPKCKPEDPGSVYCSQAQRARLDIEKLPK